MDVWGPFPILSHGGFKFYLLIVDNFSRYSWFYPLHHKSQVFRTFVQFKSMAENMFSTKIKVVQTDEVREFHNRQYQILFNSSGIVYGIVYRRSSIKTWIDGFRWTKTYMYSVETSLALLASGLVPKQYWVEAFQTVVYLINRLPTKILNYISPYEKLIGHLPDYSFLQVFGDSCYPYLRPWTSNKLDYRETRCVLLVTPHLIIVIYA